MNINRLIIVGASLLTANALASAPQQPQAKVKAFIDKMVTTQKMDRKQLNALLLNRKPNQQIIATMKRPYESKPWQQYRAIFIQPSRIDEGVKYFYAHQDTLNAVAKKYKVDPKAILGIIGVETRYGKYACTHPVLDSLYTLSFYYPKREKFFQRELSQFLKLSKEQKLDPTKVCGSYAGAIGVPQFMPSSYRHYAVDFDKTGSVDLFKSHNDAIASVANYLKKSGWQYEKPIADQAKGSERTLAKYKSKNAKRFLSAKRLKQLGIKAETPNTLTQAKRATIVDLPIDNKHNYWLAYPNFKAIMRYNPRIPYAMVVYELGEAIQNKIQQEKQKSNA